jgi:hypothetical protein
VRVVAYHQRVGALERTVEEMRQEIVNIRPCDAVDFPRGTEIAATTSVGLCSRDSRENPL